MAEQRQRAGLLVDEVAGQLGLQLGQQRARPGRARGHGERVVGHRLQGADQLLLVVHRLRQGLAARVAGEVGPRGRRAGRGG
jgi:hypothetical protein